MAFFRNIKQNNNNQKKIQPKKKAGGKATRVTIRYNVGFSNNLFIRGKGPGLSWDHGTMLKNVGPDEWVWETDTPFDDAEFKVLINDKQYEAGDNHHVHNGSWVQISPKF